MHVSYSSEYWIKPDALTIELNYQGDPQVMQVSLLAGAVVMAYSEGIISFNAAHNFRTWTIEAADTVFESKGALHVYARLDRDESSNKALIVYDPVLRNITGEPVNPSDTIEPTPTDFFYILLGKISSSMDEDGNSVPRYWETPFNYGTLNTDYYQQEENKGDWDKMFRLNKVSDLIEVLKVMYKATIQELNVSQKLTIGKGFVFDGEDIDGIAVGLEDIDESKTQLISALRVLQEIKNRALSKIYDDRTPFKLSSDTAFEVGNFVPGSSGAIIYKDKETGQAIGELDKLRVRMKAYFESLEIVNVNSLGGKQVISPAGSVRLTKVCSAGEKYQIVTAGENGNDVVKEVTVPQGIYRCFFLAEQDGQEVENRFKVGNQLQSKDFNIKKPGEYNQVANHYYWRLVTGVSTQPVRMWELGYHYVDLSVTDCDTGSDAPAKGDVVAQLGDRNDVDYQNALVFSSVDTFSPSITLYQGINSYSLVGKDAVSYGVDKTTGKAFMNVYGEMYIGDRGGNTFVRYTQANGVEIKGKLAVGTTIGDGKTIEQALEDATQSAVDTANENISNFTDTIIKDIEGLQNQIDGAIETWFSEPAPTLTNYPANGWTTNEEKNIHLGDLYYSGEGKAYRFQMEGSNYVWKLITDSDITKALADAAKAQDTADGKRTVFVKQPTDADSYQVGDLWVNATYGTTYSNDVLRAVTAKSAGSPFSINHWTKASKYTDDTKAEQVQQNVNNLSTTVNTLSGTVSGMKDFTDEAFADGIVDRSEASAIDKYLNNINTTKADVQNAYGKVYENALLDGVAKTNLANAYNAFSASATELVTSISNAIADGITTSAERADVDAKYTNFNTKYGDFVAYLNAANKYIQDKINSTANGALTQIGGLSYLKKALKEDTTIEGGLIQSSVLALGYTNEGGVYKVMSGTNGIYDAASLGGGIASWWGGAMKDRGNYTASNMPSDVAKALIRMDGSGYLANGGIWWGTDGKMHADPQSFIINENQLGDYLELFQIIYKGSTKDIDYIIPQYVMQKVEVATSVKVGEGYLKWDSTNKAFYVEDSNGNLAGLYAGWLSARGVSPVTGGGGGGSDYLRELLDVNIDAPSNNQVLSYDSASQKWVNKTIQQGLDMSAMWTELAKVDATKKIDASHLPAITKSQVESVLTGNITSHTHSQYYDANLSRTANTVLAAPNGSAGAATFRKLVANDIPTLPYVTALGTSGDYLTWTKNGVANNITVPYASSAIRLNVSMITDLNAPVWAYEDGYGISFNGYNRHSVNSPIANIDNANGLINVSFSKYETSGVYGWQINLSNLSDTLQIRRWTAGVKNSWCHLLHSGNYNSYAPTNTGTGASGTWGISITGNAATATKLGTSTVGGTAKGIYLNAGVPTALSATVGSASRPVYMDGGAITQCSYSFGNASGNAALNNGTVNTNLNADMLDGVHAKHILERTAAGSSNTGTATGWFRIAKSFDGVGDVAGVAGLLFLSRNFNYANNESYTFSINVAYGGAITITQLSGTFNNNLIGKIRVTGNAGSTYYIDLHIAISTTDNGYFWTTVGGFQSLDSWTVNPSAGSNTKEFSVVQGTKTDSSKDAVTHQLGSTVILNASGTNPYLRLTQGTNWFIQGYNNYLQLGAGVENSIKIDSVGNLILPSASANSIKFNGGSSEAIGGEIYFNGTRTCIGRAKAGDFNAGTILVSNAWTDYTKVPTNGIYSKGNILSDGTLKGLAIISSDYVDIGSIRLSYDSTNNAIKVSKKDGTAANLYTMGGLSAMGFAPGTGSGDSSISGINVNGATYRPDSNGYITLPNYPIIAGVNVNGATYSPNVNGYITLPNYPTNTGDGASGTWGISITGNAVTATKLQTARSIWGQSFNGTGDIPISVSATMPYLLFKKYSSNNYAGHVGRATSSDNIQLVGYAGNAVSLGANNRRDDLFVATTGNVGIGTASPSYKLDVSGTIHSTASVQADTYVSSRGENTSDIRLKTDIGSFNATSIIKSLRPVSFRWNGIARKSSKVLDTDAVQYGLIAQEVKVSAPWAAVDDMFGDGYMGVRYEKFIPVLMKAQIETIDEIGQLKRRLTAVERENEMLKQELQTLKAA